MQRDSARSKPSFTGLGLFILPQSKRDLYQEIWEGDSQQLEDLNAVSRWFFNLDVLRTAAGIRWASFTYSSRFRILGVLAIFGLILAKLVENSAGDLYFSGYFFLAAILTDLRNPRLRFAFEISSGFYLVNWVLSQAVVILSRTRVGDANSDSLTSQNNLVLGLAGLVLLSFGGVLMAWIRAVRDFETSKALRLIAAVGLCAALFGQRAAHYFVALADFLPNEVIARFHSEMSILNGLSQTALVTLVLLATAFQLRSQRN